MSEKYTAQDLIDLKSDTMRGYAAQFERHYASGLAKILGVSELHAALAQDFEAELLEELREAHGEAGVALQTNGNVAPYTLLLYLGENVLDAFSQGKYAFVAESGLESIVKQLIERDDAHSAQEKGILEENLLLGLATTFLLTSVYMTEDPVVSKYLQQPATPQVENNVLEYAPNGRNIVKINTTHDLDEEEQKSLRFILKLRPEIDETTIDISPKQARYGVFDL
ncbi:hypothetical protein LPAF129_13950 [Ligilactobacillus pabuli]|uniref:Uncharacterized protein n=1 Tax=Ligilactobacillus pabuli TaxID=2886039 RepID=A0ABQ5JI61_9LACO|nr:hypothetical protein [Ligilactobacillus pabuli]GKS81709.1 hypothetical protein LPAF129_13950 [Ligilactobacillus pabuli]HIW89209.1 hypothetical protein [Candidatus Ligilactobacillus excrementipullorum]